MQDVYLADVFLFIIKKRRKDYIKKKKNYQLFLNM